MSAVRPEATVDLGASACAESFDWVFSALSGGILGDRRYRAERSAELRRISFAGRLCEYSSPGRTAILTFERAPRTMPIIGNPTGTIGFALLLAIPCILTEPASGQDF